MNKKQLRDNQANEEKALILNPKKLEKQKNEKRKKVLISVLCGLVIVVAVGFASFQAVRAIGKSNLQNKVEATRPELKSEAIPEDKKDDWQEGWITYQGKIYAYNEDIMTFLFMGIDKNSDVKEMAEGTNGGQADALFLAVMNPHDNTIKVVGINRNTMTDIDIYDENGAYVTTTQAQIAVQHGFGNGVEKSCEFQKKAVSKLFYGLPIHGYAAINMSAIPTINDTVGGVDVTVLEDLQKIDASLKKGEKIHLMGQSAFWYVKYRDTNTFGSADLRLERQKQYLNSFIKTAKSSAKKDISIAIDLYKEIIPMMTTNVTIDEVAYLAPILVEYQFNQDSFYMPTGETVMGTQFEEFYVDEDDLYEMILEVFYEEVDEAQREK